MGLGILGDILEEMGCAAARCWRHRARGRDRRPKESRWQIDGRTRAAPPMDGEGFGDYFHGGMRWPDSFGDQGSEIDEFHAETDHANVRATDSGIGGGESAYSASCGSRPRDRF